MEAKKGRGEGRRQKKSTIVFTQKNAIKSYYSLFPFVFKRAGGGLPFPIPSRRRTGKKGIKEGKWNRSTFFRVYQSKMASPNLLIPHPFGW